MYLVYINDLMDVIDASEDCFKLYNTRYGCPTVADDMMLISYTKNGLQHLMNLCYDNSVRNNYSYNASKCKVVVYNETNSDYKQAERKWTLGPNSVEEGDKFLHLGITNFKNPSLDTSVNECCSKLRSTYFSLNSCGISRDCMHPLSLKRIYETVVLSKALYGSELWNNLSESHIQSLERAHRQCVKHIQGIPRNTSNVVALSCIGIMPLELYIDKRKLLLFSQLCILDANKGIKRMFTSRLVHFMQRPSKISGFMPDIYRILGKYGLLHVLTQYLSDATFPSKGSWKSLVNRSIKSYLEEKMSITAESNHALYSFKEFHKNQLIPCNIWSFCKLYRDQLNYGRSVILIVSRLFSRKYDTLCPRCKQSVNCIATHLVHFCSANAKLREVLWKSLLSIIGEKNFNTLIKLDPQNQIVQLISGCVFADIDDQNRVKCFKLCLKHLHGMVFILRCMS